MEMYQLNLMNIEHFDNIFQVAVSGMEGRKGSKKDGRNSAR